MWWRRKASESERDESAPQPLREALRRARIEAAERTDVVVDLRDAEAARLELVDDALDPLFAEIPADIDLFDRGLSHGDPPRLWIDVIAHIHMGRDKRTYRFVQDSRNGRQILAESSDVTDIVAAVTRYVAGRMLEREYALSVRGDRRGAEAARPRRGRRIRTFLFGVIVGIAAVFAFAWLSIR